jgi:RNA polymerase sigma-70 factor (ECF subfamily)
VDESLSAIFRSRLGMLASPEVDACLDRAVARARAAWPELPVNVAGFVEFLAESLADEPDASTALEARHVDDLYLAFACLERSAHAHRAFERDYLVHVDRFVARFGRGPAFADEIRQQLRERLLLGRGDSGPRLAEYAGLGPLLAWVRVAAARAAIDLARKNAAAPGHEDLHEVALAADGTDAEARAIKARHGAELQAALEAALAALTAKQRTLLRMHYVDGYSLERMAVAYRVHRATVARWLQTARAELVRRTREHAVARLAVPAAELSSLLRVLQSQLHISIETYFAKRR